MFGTERRMTRMGQCLRRENLGDAMPKAEITPDDGSLGTERDVRRSIHKS